MPQSGFTPVQTYSSSTPGNVPLAANLINSTQGAEMAINIADGKLFYKDSSGNVQIIASKAGNINVSSLSFGTTGLTPSTATTGAITVAGTLNVANGGTGLTSLTAGYIPYGNGTSAFSSSANLTFNGSTQLSINTTGGAPTGGLYLTYSGTQVASFTSNAATGEVRIGATNSTGTFYSTFYSNNAEAMRITSTGYVGINNSSPSYQLDVAQSINSDGGIQITNSNTGVSAISEFRASNGTNFATFGIGGVNYSGYAQVRAGGASIYTSSAAGVGISADNASGYITFGTGATAPERMRITAAGFVGIGTSSPGTNLDVSNGTYHTQIQVDSGDNGVIFTNTSGTKFSIGSSFGVYGPGDYMSVNHYNGSAWGEFARFDANGSFLAGITTPLGPARIAASQNITSWSAIACNHTLGAGQPLISFANAANNAIIGSITNNGNTGVLYNITSDRRLKSNIAPLTDSGTIIDALLPRTFTWNEDGSQSKGFITDEYQQVFPNAITGQPNAVDAEGKPVYQQGDFSTSEFMAVLVAEIQSLRARLKAANIA